MSVFSENNVFLVTGASSGIGRAITHALVRAGAAVIANGRNLERLQETKAGSEHPERLYCEPLDLAENLETLPAWLKSLAQKYGPLSGMATSAGITWNSPLVFYPLQKVRQIFDICCHAPMILSSAFRQKRIHARGGGSIVHIAALAAIDANPGQGVYAEAKAALIAGSRCMSKETAQDRIRVNCISPGLIKTPMFEATCAQLGPSFQAREEVLYPLGLGQPEDVANLALFLLSDASRWITGQNFPVTGGR